MNKLAVLDIEQRYQATREAFDSVAAQYHGPAGNNRLVSEMRTVLCRTVLAVTRPGAQLLDLGCGTGLDAVFFAGKGFQVEAIDWSPDMIEQTRRTADEQGVTGRVTAVKLGIHELARMAGRTFDCIYSDLGALNCVDDPGRVAEDCAPLLKEDGTLVFSVIGRYCPWELAYYGLRGDWGRMKARLQAGQVPVGLNGRTVWTRYYSPQEFYACFKSRFVLRHCRGLNLFLPPPYLGGPFEKRPAWLKPLAWLDDRFASLPVFNRVGDHFLMVMSRRATDGALLRTRIASPDAESR